MFRQVLPPTSAQLEAARRVVADHLTPTPTITLTIDGRPVRVKMESLQPTGSFKVRGALSALDALRREAPGTVVITSSAGNHGLGIAFAAETLGVKAVVVVPENASPAKVKKLRGFDVELIQHGSSYDDAQRHAKALAEERSLAYVSPFNNSDVIAGQATIMAEMLEQAPELEHVVVSVGGGGLLSGALFSRDALDRSDVKFTGVQPTNSAALYHVLRGVAMDDVEHEATIADGLAGGGDEDSITNEIIRQWQVPLVLVDEPLIREGLRRCLVDHGVLIEGSAAASFAAIAYNLVNDPFLTIGFVASGRNIAVDLLREILGEDSTAK
jgi:threonine dehydratase